MRMDGRRSTNTTQTKLRTIKGRTVINTRAILAIFLCPDDSLPCTQVSRKKAKGCISNKTKGRNMYPFLTKKRPRAASTTQPKAESCTARPRAESPLSDVLTSPGRFLVGFGFHCAEDLNASAKLHTGVGCRFGSRHNAYCTEGLNA